MQYDIEGTKAGSAKRLAKKGIGMTTKLGLEQRFEVKDGPRTISFLGWELATADSSAPGSAPARWTELSLYKTTTGRYVLQKVGRSDVFHDETCEPKRGKRWNDLEQAADETYADDDESVDLLFVPCEQCNPDYDASPVWVERDIFSASDFNNAAQVLEALYRPDTRNSTKYLSRVARELLDQAKDSDDEISRVLNAPVDVT